MFEATRGSILTRDLACGMISENAAPIITME